MHEGQKSNAHMKGFRKKILFDNIVIGLARNSTLRETIPYIAQCASALTWSYLAERWPTQLVTRSMYSISDLHKKGV